MIEGLCSIESNYIEIIHFVPLNAQISPAVQKPGKFIKRCVPVPVSYQFFFGLINYTFGNLLLLFI